MKQWPQYFKNPNNEKDPENTKSNILTTNEIESEWTQSQKEARDSLLRAKLQLEQLKQNTAEMRVKFQDKVFNGHNGYPHPTPYKQIQRQSPAPRSYPNFPPTLPSYSQPDDYKFYPHPSVPVPAPISNVKVTVVPHGEPDLSFKHNYEEPSARNLDIFDYDDDDDQVDRSYKRDADAFYDDYLQFKQPEHFTGFEGNSLLSQVGRVVNSRFTKSVQPSPVGVNHVPDLDEPLFYPDRPLTPPPKLKLKGHIPEGLRDRLQSKSSEFGPSPHVRSTHPSPTSPSPNHYQVTQPYRATPLPPHSPSPSPYQSRPPPAHTPRPIPQSYYSKPLPYSSSHNSGHFKPSLTTASPFKYSPTPSPYIGYRKSSDDSPQSIAPPTASSYYSNSNNHIHHATQKNIGFKKIE